MKLQPDVSAKRISARQALVTAAAAFGEGAAAATATTNRLGLGPEESLRQTGADVQAMIRAAAVAGPFGFETEKYSVSPAVGERVLLPAVRNTPADTLIVSDGFSCREQIQQSTGRRALHLAEALRLGSK
jgi:hypothetical protein